MNEGIFVYKLSKTTAKGKPLKMYVRLAYEYEPLDLGKSIVLYNEITAKTYTIDAKNVAMVRELIKGTTEELLLKKYGNQWNTFFDILKQNYAVVISEKPVCFFDTWVYGAKGISAKDKNVMPKIQFLTLQLTDKCSFQCNSCNSLYEFPCLVCESSSRNHELQLDALFKFIDSLYIYGLKEVVIEGGDPLTIPNKLIKVIDFIQKKSNGKINIVVKTNGVLLQSDALLLKKLKSRKVTLNIILNREYNESQKGLLDILRIKGLRYSTTTLSSGNSVESPCIQKLDSNEYLVLEKVFLESDTLDRNTIFNYYHPCIVGKIYVSADGNISACRELLKNGYRIGNIDKDEISSIVSDLKSLWQKPEIEAKNCLKCKNRKHCHSCPSLKHTMNGKINCPFTD